jgi:hypothetical protein
MHTRLPATLAILVLLGLNPVAALAAECGAYPLTPEQQQYIDVNALAIEIPEGEVPVIQRCDTNLDGAVDIIDIRAISMKRNQPAAHPDDPMDWDKNGTINLLDARGCQQACSLPRCAVSSTPPPPSSPPAGVIEDASCFQVADINGDGEDDFAGIFEYTGSKKRIEGWTLEVVLVYKDENGEIQHSTFPFVGERTETELSVHVSRQPAGVVDLLPGSVTIDEPGVVSYRNGKPAVLYYTQNGKVKRAAYGVEE